MTKTETQIAEENIKIEKEYKGFITDTVCKTHKSSCERFLEFLSWLINQNMNIWGMKGLEEKITDLKQAIKLYSENGI